MALLLALAFHSVFLPPAIAILHDSAFATQEVFLLSELLLLFLLFLLFLLIASWTLIASSSCSWTMLFSFLSVLLQVVWVEMIAKTEMSSCRTPPLWKTMCEGGEGRPQTGVYHQTQTR